MNEIERLLKNLLEKVDVRGSLSSLREAMKDPKTKEYIVSWVKEHKDKLIELFHEEDAKARKNLALFLGETGIEDFARDVYEAYIKETTSFVKSSYLDAIKNFDYSSYIDSFKNKAREITQSEPAAEIKKHVEAELKSLNKLILGAEKESRHTFTGYTVPTEVMLHTMRCGVDVLVRDLKEQLGINESEIKSFPSGVQITCNDLRALSRVRSYGEMYFMVPGMKTGEQEPEILAKRIHDADLVSFLDARYEGNGGYTYRTEIKTKKTLDKKALFIKRFTGALDLLSNGKLVNSASHYEIEIRLVENKNGNFNILIRPCSLADTRFDYRKDYEPTSITPKKAAVLMGLAEGYLKEGAQVLDPFCGVGTLLIERFKRVKANTTYGIDLYGNAIEKARANTERAGQIIHYINRDFFEFTHEYMFDEIVTDMPYRENAAKGETLRFYNRFFEKASQIVKDNGTLIVYTKDHSVIEESNTGRFKLVKDFSVSDTEETHLLIFV